MQQSGPEVTNLDLWWIPCTPLYFYEHRVSSWLIWTLSSSSVHRLDPFHGYNMMHYFSTSFGPCSRLTWCTISVHNLDPVHGEWWSHYLCSLYDMGLAHVEYIWRFFQVYHSRYVHGELLHSLIISLKPIHDEYIMHLSVHYTIQIYFILFILPTYLWI